MLNKKEVFAWALQPFDEHFQVASSAILSTEYVGMTIFASLNYNQKQSKLQAEDSRDNVQWPAEKGEKIDVR